MQTAGTVERAASLRVVGVALATLLSCALHGCTHIDGGAVELSWDLEGFDGSRITKCLDGRIDPMRLWWQVGLTPDSHDFPCRDSHGVTSFEVPPGEALLWVEPQCASGTAVSPASYIAPAPLERTITVGDVVELHAVVIEIDVDHACL